MCQLQSVKFMECHNSHVPEHSDQEITKEKLTFIEILLNLSML